MFEELHLARLENERTRREIEGLRLAIGVHFVSRKQAAAMLGCVPKTVARYEKRKLIDPARIDRPGVHYLHADVVMLARKLELNVAD